MISTQQLPSWNPRSYQIIGVELMIKQACAGLLWKPGRGKTSVVYMAFRILQEKGYVDRMLVICPIRPAYRVWPHQCEDYEDFKDFKVGLLHGPDKEKVLADDDVDIFVINPEGLPWLLGHAGRAQRALQLCQMLVVDESTKFANPATQRFKLLKKWVPKFKRRYILTGSPRPKSLMDLFGQVYVLDEGAALGRFITHYRTSYFFPSGFGGYDWQPQAGAQTRIMEQIAPLVHVMDTEEGLELPELLINDIWVDLPPAALKLYKEMENALMAQVESGNIVAANAAVASGKCRQISNGTLIHTEDGEYTEVHDAKLDALADLMEQLGGEPLLVTYEFVADKCRIEERLKIPSISSGNAKKDDQLIQQFSRGMLPAVQGHPQSISLGIDGLQKNCADIAMFGVTWSLLNYEQVIQRVRRSGNKKSVVTLHRILARGTVDEKVIKILDKRERAQDDFMALLKTLSNR